MKELNLKAIVAGVAVDIAATFVLGILGTAVMAARLVARGLSYSEAIRELSLLGHNIVYTAFVLIVGFGMTVVGGYVAARLAKHDEVLNAAFVGGVSVVLGLLLTVENTPHWYRLLGLALPIPCGALGGYIFLRTRNL